MQILSCLWQTADSYPPHNIFLKLHTRYQYKSTAKNEHIIWSDKKISKDMKNKIVVLFIMLKTIYACDPIVNDY